MLEVWTWYNRNLVVQNKAMRQWELYMRTYTYTIGTYNKMTSTVCNGLLLQYALCGIAYIKNVLNST